MSFGVRRLAVALPWALRHAALQGQHSALESDLDSLSAVPATACRAWSRPQRLDARAQADIHAGRYKPGHLDYDWSLNDDR